MNQTERKNLIKGLHFSKELSINHLFFADDGLIFSRAIIEDCSNLKKFFDSYAAASGQIFNFKNFSMLFSGSTQPVQIASIKNLFQLQVVSNNEKYLGIPSMVGRKKLSFFNDIKLKVLSKISNWNSKMFSRGGKEVLIKAVAQAIPAYVMSVFKLPIGLCEDIQQAVARFWWSSKPDQRVIHWSNWRNMCQAKCRGGMGFKDLICFNQALVGKQSWQIIQNSNSLLARVLKARYFKDVEFLKAKLGSKSSFIWRSIL